MLQNLQLGLYLISASIKARMQYKVNFFITVTLAMPYQFLALFIVWIIQTSFKNIGGWNYAELGFLNALFLLCSGLAMTFFDSFRSMESYVINGTLDRFLLRPYSVFYQVFINNFDFVVACSQVIPACLILVYFAIKLNIVWSASLMIFLLFSIICGVCIQLSTFIIIGSSAFWIYRSRDIGSSLMYSFQDFLRYPLSIYNKNIQMFLSIIFPFAFINYYPTAFIAEKLEGEVLILLPIITVIYLVVSILYWNVSIRRYQSSGN